MSLGALLNESSPAKAYILEVGAVDVLPRVPLDVAPVTWTDEASNGVGELNFVVEHTGSWATRPALERGARVRFKKLGETLTFGGTLLRVTYTRGVTGHFAECTAVDHNWWFDHRVVPRFTSKVDLAGRNRRMTNDRNIVVALIERRMPPLRGTWSTIDSTRDDMPLVKTEGMTAREVMEHICDLAQYDQSPYPRRFYADAYRRVHYYMNNEGEAAPYVVGGAGIDVEDLELEYDSMDVKHHVYVRGKNAKGSGWVYNKGSDYALGAVSTFIDRPNCDSVKERNQKGRAFLRRQEELVAGSFRVQATTGWRAGQLLTISDTQLGLSSDTHEIRRVNGELHPGSHTVHDIEFGAPKRWLSRDLKRRDLL